MNCRECERPMVSKGNRTGALRHHGRGLCEACYRAARFAGHLDRYPPIMIGKVQPPHDQAGCGWCEDIVIIAAAGSPEEWARRLDTSLVALGRRLYRHGHVELGRRAEGAIRASRAMLRAS